MQQKKTLKHLKTSQDLLNFFYKTRRQLIPQRVFRGPLTLGLASARLASPPLHTRAQFFSHSHKVRRVAENMHKCAYFPPLCTCPDSKLKGLSRFNLHIMQSRNQCASTNVNNFLTEPRSEATF